MIGNKSSSILLFSDRLYRLLLALYPADHRHEYGPHMAQVFRDVCHDAYAQQGTCGVLGAWLPVLFDLAITALEEHRRKGIRMSKSTLIRLSGPILIVAGVLLMSFSVSLLSPRDFWDTRGLYRVAYMMIGPAFVLLAIGLIGVYMRFAARVNRLGRLGLMLAIAGAFGFGILFLVGVATEEAVGLLLFLLPHFGMILFGISTAQSRALPRWNVLPLLVGLLPFVVVVRQIYSAPGPYYFLFGVFALVGLGYMLFGYVVLSDVSQQATAAAG